MKIVAGLGNPGREYQATRHNVGFAVLEELARRHAAPAPRVKFEAEVTEIQVGTERTLLLAPQTYMNLSGRSVRKAADFYQLTAGDVLVVCDDFHLDLGRIRLRKGGTSGGQKGLEDILRHFGTRDVPRLRLGIGPAPAGRDKSSFVLARFTAAERELIDPAVRRAADAVEAWVRDGVESAMNRFNMEPEPPASAGATG